MSDEASVFITTAPNDRDMILELGALAVPVPLEFGDCCFWGNSGEEEALRVCIERKKLGDMAGCIHGGRYLFQAQRAKDAGFNVLILIVEGRTRRSPLDGCVETPGWDSEKQRKGWVPVIPSIQYSRWAQYLHALSYQAGVLVMRSEDVRETADVIKALYHWFQQPPDKHNSLHAIFVAPPNKTLLVPPSLIRKLAATLPGIGWERSHNVEQYFGSIQDMMAANEDEWLKVEGVGKKTAASIVSAIQKRRVYGNR